MKKTVFSILAIGLVLSSCVKENKGLEPAAPKCPFPETITAIMDEDVTKTDYDANGIFSWKENDAVRLIVSNSENYQGYYGYKATTIENNGKYAIFTADNGSGPIVDFSNDTWTSTGFAIYPYTISRPQSGTAYNGYGAPFVTLRQAVSGNKSDIILVGQAMSDNSNFKFKTAMSVLKVTLKNIPAAATDIFLVSNPDAYPIDGDFLIQEDGSFVYTKYGDSHTSKGGQSVDISSEGAVASKDYYFNIPVGTCPAGTMTVYVVAGEKILLQKTIMADMTFERNKLYMTPELEVPEVTVDVDEVIGTYGTFVTTSWIGSNNYQTGLLQISASDDPSKGNIMITKFAGISGKQYGTYDGATLTFPADQLFCDNPFSNASDHPSLALDAYWYGPGVVDFVLTKDNYGNLMFKRGGDSNGAYDAIGFRATSEDAWINNNHNGGWPWEIAYGNLIAFYVTGEEIPLTSSMVSVNLFAGSKDGSAYYDGGGASNLVDGDYTTYWHTPYISASDAESYGYTNAYSWEDLDPTYGAYIDIDLGAGNTVTDFTFYSFLRSAGGNFPQQVNVYSSADGSSWNAVGSSASVFTASGSVASPIPCQGSAARYIRISIVTNNGGQDLRNPSAKACTHLAEIKIFKE